MKKRYTFFVILSLIVLVFNLLICISLFRTINSQTILKRIIFVIAYIFIFISIIAIIISQSYFLNEKRTLEKRLGLWNTITYNVKGAGETAFNELPIGIIIFDASYHVCWSNNEAKKYLMSPLNNVLLSVVANGALYDFILNDEKTNIIEIYDNIYEVKYLKKYNVIYLTKITELYSLKKRYKERTLAIGYLNVDNFDQALVDLDVQEKTDFSAQVIKAIVEWTDKFDAYVRPLSESKFLLITDNLHLEEMEKDKFTILDEIKLIVYRSKSSLITLSMGIMCDDKDINSLSNGANSQIELAENRGGDQVVVLNHDVLNFYGAKTDPVHKESKVDIRYKYQHLENLMNNSSSIFIIGHNNQDADAFGSCIGLYNLGVALGKPTYIILSYDVIDSTVKKVFKDVERLHPSLFNKIILPKRALELKDDNSLLLICDCQAEINLFVNPSFIYSFKHIGVIDHHRKNEYGTVNNIEFYYCNPGASSSVELVVSLLQFAEKKLTISSLEATWMMLGIIVDTNNFVYRTTSTTFEVASYLNQLQANIFKVQDYLKEDVDEKILRNKLMSNIEFYRNFCAIAIQSKEDYEAGQYLEPNMLAKVSDELIKINNVEYAVTIGYVDAQTIRLSSRSLGRINCQLIMEFLGGGGHLTGAACTVRNRSMDDIIVDLKRSIDKIVLSSEGTTKVILINKIKNVGERGTVKEVPFEQAQKWLEQGLVILATYENIRLFEQEKDENQALLDGYMKTYRDLKEKLEEKPIVVYAKLREDGIIKQSDVVNEIIKYCNKISNVHLDANKIEINKILNAFGTYQVKIMINQDIIADTKVSILDKN